MSAPGSQLSIASTFVLGGMEPLRLVVHHADGSWDFLCNTAADVEFLVAVHAEEVFEQFPADLAALRTLPRLPRRTRDLVGRVIHEPFEDDE